MSKRFIVTNHEFINTGGGIMVSVFSVYDTVDNVTRYVLCNEEGFALQTVNTVTMDAHDIVSDEMMDSIIVGNWTWDMLTSEPSHGQHLFTEEEFELYKFCQFEYYRRYCKYFNTTVNLSLEDLPFEMHNQLSFDYITWLIEEGQLVETDGYKAIINSRYTPPAPDYSPREDLERQLQEIKDFRKWFNDLVGPQADEEDIQKLYGTFITISVAGNSVKIPFDAVTCNNIDTVLKQAIEEW